VRVEHLSGAALLIGRGAVKGLQVLVDAKANGPEEVGAVAADQGTNTKSALQSSLNVSSAVLRSVLDVSGLQSRLWQGAE
jgi:hypothetical protein